MQVTREDLGHVDELIRALNKLRFDVNGLECMRLSASLFWFGQFRQNAQGEIQAAEAEHEKRVQQGLALLARQTEPAPTAAQQPPAELVTKTDPPAAPAPSPRRGAKL